MILIVLFGCNTRPYVEVLDPSADVVVDVGSTVDVLAFAWDQETSPEGLMIDAWYGADSVEVYDPSSEETDGGALRWLGLSLVVEASEQLRIFVTDEEGRVDSTVIDICIDAGDCGQATASTTGTE